MSGREQQLRIDKLAEEISLHLEFANVRDFVSQVAILFQIHSLVAELAKLDYSRLMYLLVENLSKGRSLDFAQDFVEEVIKRPKGSVFITDAYILPNRPVSPQYLEEGVPANIIEGEASPLLNDEELDNLPKIGGVSTGGCPTADYTQPLMVAARSVRLDYNSGVGRFSLQNNIDKLANIFDQLEKSGDFGSGLASLYEKIGEAGSSCISQADKRTDLNKMSKKEFERYLKRVGAAAYNAFVNEIPAAKRQGGCPKMHFEVLGNNNLGMYATGNIYVDIDEHDNRHDVVNTLLHEMTHAFEDRLVNLDGQTAKALSGAHSGIENDIKWLRINDDGRYIPAKGNFAAYEVQPKERSANMGADIFINTLFSEPDIVRTVYVNHAARDASRAA